MPQSSGSRGGDKCLGFGRCRVERHRPVHPDRPVGATKLWIKARDRRVGDGLEPLQVREQPGVRPPLAAPCLGSPSVKVLGRTADVKRVVNG